MLLLYTRGGLKPYGLCELHTYRLTPAGTKHPYFSRAGEDSFELAMVDFGLGGRSVQLAVGVEAESPEFLGRH